MKFRVWGDLKAQKTQAWLTAFSMYLGVLALCAVTTAQDLATIYVVASHEQLRGREYTYSVPLTGLNVSDSTIEGIINGVSQRLTPQNAQVVRSSQTSGQVITSRGSVDATILRLEHPIDTVFRRTVIAGEGLTVSGIGPRPLAISVYLNEYAASQLGVSHIPAAVQISADQGVLLNAVVDGVIEDRLEDPILYAHYNDAVWPVESAATALLVVAPHITLNNVRETVKSAALFHGVRYENPIHQLDTVDEARASVAMVSQAFTLCGVIALVVSAVGILNVGLASVREKSREYVIRRALGGRQIDIIWQVLSANLALGIIVFGLAVVTLLGLVAALSPILQAVYPLLDRVSLSWTSVAIGGVAAVVTSLLSGVIPALSAARLDVADALRR